MEETRKPMLQILKPLEFSIMSVILLIGIVALATEISEYEEIAKVVVIPSLILLIIVSSYSIIRTLYPRR